MPKGGLAILATDRPRFDARRRSPAAGSVLALVLDEDTGSAIVGARVDLFWGRGKEAGQAAGVMKQKGRIWYLAPRQSQNQTR